MAACYDQQRHGVLIYGGYVGAFDPPLYDTWLLRRMLAAAFTEQPLDVIVRELIIVRLSCAVSGDGPISYQWRRNGVNLADSVRISGSQTATLIIHGAQFSDEGSFDVVATSPLGSIASAAATVDVLCYCDIGGDGFVNGIDFDDFVLAFELGEPAADVDENGQVNEEDFDSYVEHFVTGC